MEDRAASVTAAAALSSCGVSGGGQVCAMGGCV